MKPNSLKASVSIAAGNRPEPERPAPAAPVSPMIAPSRAGKKALTFFISEEAYKELRQLALDNRSSNQALGVEAINLLLTHYGRKPIA